MGTITLPLKAKHFKNASYIDVCGCPIARAAKEFFNATYANEGVDVLSVLSVGMDMLNKSTYQHERYSEQFDADKARATELSFDETIIRTIELIPVWRRKNT